MTAHIIETVTFRLEDGVSKQRFLETVAASTEFIKSRPGFIARRLSCGKDGTWVEHIEWATLEAAQSAAAALPKTESVRPFLDCINGPSAVMRHSVLAVSA